MGHKVLLADDSITVQKIVKLSLTEEGIEVIAVGNGEQAVQQLETMRPDLVMADVFMPGKDGYEVCQYVKSHPQLNNLPVILLVHAFEPFDPDRAQKVGADHQLTKPFQSIRTLVTTVQELLQSSAGAKPATQNIETPVATPAPAPITPLTPTNQQEEFAVVSSLTPSTDLQEGSVSAFDAMSLSDMPASASSTSPATFQSQQSGMPLPLTGSFGMSKADLLPPSDLAVLSTPEWQSPAPASTAWQPSPVTMDAPLQAASQPEASSVSFQPLSLDAEPPSVNGSSDDVLELSEVLMDSVETPAATVAPAASSFAHDASMLSVFGNAPIPFEATQPAPTPAETDPSTFAGSFDVAAGHVSSEAAPVANANPAQDLNEGTVSTSGAIAASQMSGQISEAVIEEIVNRVIQRLSTNAIQEIAWEVVPEMAELLIRKQISQQKQLAH